MRHQNHSIFGGLHEHNISKVCLFGSAARGDDSDISDVDSLIEMDDGASAMGVGGFQFEVEQLLGVGIDVIPTFVLPEVDDRDFVRNIQNEAVPL